MVPGYEQVKPVLALATDSRAAAYTELSGEIRFDHVSFWNSADVPLIIDDVSIHIRPGEFVAIVDESSACKSTLNQMALALEAPSAGSKYCDGRDLANLDSRSVRRQIGVIIQNGAL